MKNLSTWLLTIFMVMFWVFRVAVVFKSQYGGDFLGFSTSNTTVEIIVLFITVLCVFLVTKRKIIGAIAYLISYAYLFGTYLYKNFENILNMNINQNDLVSIIAIVLAICVFVDIIIEKIQKSGKSENKTDWYYKNKEYDRKLDERADKNNYRNY